MTELGTRSASQILRTFLPQQTADLKGGIYKVVEWTGAPFINVDQDIICRRLLREIMPWTRAHTDNGFAADLRSGARVEVVELDDRRGVEAQQFPEVWLCRACRRIGRRRQENCRCGVRRWGQLHFVGFHSCGALVEPWIKRCPQHDDVMLISPRSAQAKDIRFVCPACKLELMRGLGFRKCVCGEGNINWNVHKARSVYVPRGAVLVNPPRPERMRDLLAAGGARQALSWLVDGISASSPASMEGKPTRGTFIANLLRQGMDPDFAEKMATFADESGQLAPEDGKDDIDLLPVSHREEAEHEAVDIAMALAEGHMSTVELAGSSSAGGVLATRYASDYPTALTHAGFAGIDLVERFPVLNIMYGYTRGGGDAATSRLVPFRRARGGYRLHGSLSETEALFFRLDPVRVAHWLIRRGHTLTGFTAEDEDPRRARIALLGSAEIPLAGDEPPTATVGSDLLTLVHSYAHRFIRQAAVYAGIDRDALAEYLVPLHLGFFIYAAARGDFVLGGLQAVFEADLSSLVNSAVDGEHRCALDPGCSRGAGACFACLHIGEPSCRYFNTYLNRAVLFGRIGYLARHAPTVTRQDVN
jgi:hypothetical protein